jgi:hypothetical protein
MSFGDLSKNTVYIDKWQFEFIFSRGSADTPSKIAAEIPPCEAMDEIPIDNDNVNVPCDRI